MNNSIRLNLRLNVEKIIKKIFLIRVAVEINRDQLAAIAVGLLVFVGSIYFSPWYIEGDQWVYKRAYRIVEGLDLLSAYWVYDRAVSGGEFVHFLVVWIASTLAIEKDLVMAYANALLAGYSLMLIRAYGGSIYLAIFLVLTNFYWYVLYFSAERLKFGILFLVISLLNMNRVSIFLIFSVLALYSHYSLLFIYAGILLMVAVRYAKGIQQFQSINIMHLFAAGVILILVFQMGSFHIYAKLTTYLSLHNSGNIIALGPVLILMALSCWRSRQLLEPIVLYIPVMVGIFFLGGSRLNMLAYFLSFYHCLPLSKGLNFGMFSLAIYFALKSIGYVVSVIEFGHGFGFL